MISFGQPGHPVEVDPLVLQAHPEPMASNHLPETLGGAPWER